MLTAAKRSVELLSPVGAMVGCVVAWATCVAVGGAWVDVGCSTVGVLMLVGPGVGVAAGIVGVAVGVSVGTSVVGVADGSITTVMLGVAVGVRVGAWGTTQVGVLV